MEPSSSSLLGKRALVCASSQGLGYATARSLARRGCSVVLNGRHHDKLLRAAEQLRHELGEDSVEVTVASADLSQPLEIAKLWGQVTQGGPVDILVTNTGGPPPGTFSQFDDSAWQGAFEGLFLSAVRLFRLALPDMRERRFGRLITITSSSAREPLDGLILSTAMRAALAGLVKTLAKEEAKHGITVNNVCPSLTSTERLEKLFEVRAEKAGRTLEEERAVTLATLPRGSFVQPEEFGEVVAFLASPEASALSGLSLNVDAASSKFLF